MDPDLDPYTDSLEMLDTYPDPQRWLKDTIVPKNYLSCYHAITDRQKAQLEACDRKPSKSSSSTDPEQRCKDI